MTHSNTITRRPITLPAGFSFHCVEVPGGSFSMGSADEEAYDGEKPIHTVQVPGFWMAEYPTTQELWLAVLGGENPAYFPGAQRPVESVSWYEAAAFCNALNACFGYPAKYYVDEKRRQALNAEWARTEEAMAIYSPPAPYGFRLPTEAEWEFAATSATSTPLGDRAATERSRAATERSRGERLKYAGSNQLDEVGWYRENSHGQTQPVGLKLPNELGIYDLSGNVWEWCEDQWHDNYEGAPTDGSAWIDRADDVSRVIRGGCWGDFARYCRPSFRGDNRPASRGINVGFRVVLVPPPGSWPVIQTSP
jgi:formylglycine-generating enzyme required for sulfatase activity